MKLSELIDRRSIILGRSIRSKEEAIDTLLDSLGALDEVTEPKAALRGLVMKREKLGATAFHSGIAIPHLRIDNFERLVLGVCIPSDPIKADSISIRMVVLMIVGKQAPSSHVNVLATLLKMSQDESLFASLCAARSPAELITLLDEAEVEVKKELTVRDIMESPAITVSAYTNLRDLTNLFNAESISYAPVVNEEGVFVGEVDAFDLIRVGIPDYAHMMGSLRFTHSFEPFEELLKNEERILVDEVMREPSAILDPDDTVMDAALELDQTRRRCLPVVRDRMILGVVSEMDILSKVLRGR